MVSLINKVAMIVYCDAASIVELALVEKYDHEELEDTGCVGGGCTL